MPIEIYELRELFYNQGKLRELSSRIRRDMQGSSTLPGNAMVFYFCQMHIIETFHQSRNQRGHRHSADKIRREEEGLLSLKHMISSRSIEEADSESYVRPLLSLHASLLLFSYVPRWFFAMIRDKANLIASNSPRSMPSVNVSNPQALAGAMETSHKGSSGGEKGENLSCPFRKRNPVRFSMNTHPQCALRSFKSITLLK